MPEPLLGSDKKEKILLYLMEIKGISIKGLSNRKTQRNALKS